MKKTVKVVLPILLGVLIAVVLLGSLVTTRPNEYTIVKQFGKVVRVIDQPGLSLKTPFVQSTSTLPKTEMLYDLAASDVITSDKKSMVADSFVLWRIVDPLKFIQTLSGSVSGAEARLDQAVYNSLKTVISSMKQEDVISVATASLPRASPSMSTTRPSSAIMASKSSPSRPSASTCRTRTRPPSTSA